jgi:hypothetical protein
MRILLQCRDPARISPAREQRDKLRRSPKPEQAGEQQRSVEAKNQLARAAERDDA